MPEHDRYRETNGLVHPPEKLPSLSLLQGKPMGMHPHYEQKRGPRRSPWTRLRHVPAGFVLHASGDWGCEQPVGILRHRLWYHQEFPSSLWLHRLRFGHPRHVASEVCGVSVVPQYREPEQDRRTLLHSCQWHHRGSELQQLSSRATHLAAAGWHCSSNSLQIVPPIRRVLQRRHALEVQALCVGRE